MTLRTHQSECINKIEQHFELENRALIKMFCGSGKSFIIYHCLLQYTKSISIVVVPSINLITQFNRDYLLDQSKKKYNDKYFKNNFKTLTICSKNELSNDNVNFTPVNNTDTITEFFELTGSKIILITYQSLKQFAEIIKEEDVQIDLVCFDEAHHILADNMKELLFGTNDEQYDYDNSNSQYSNNSDNESNYDSDVFSEQSQENDNFLDCYVKKTLFFTATPKNTNGIKMYNAVTEITIDDQDYDIVDDENTCFEEEPHCGKMVYEYMHIEGVNDGILNDFNIRVDMYTENTNESIFEAISRTILETGNNRALTFHSRSETKSDKGSDVLSFSNDQNLKLFEKAFKKVQKEEFPKLKDKYKSIKFEGITANTKNKSDILKQFEDTLDDEIYIVASCKTIGEGTDTKSANLVCFVDPKQSYTEIIQNIGRICRLQNKLSTVLIPTYVDVSKYKKCKTPEDRDKVIRDEMSKTGNFNGILNVLSALRQEDQYLFELCLKYPEVYTQKELEDNFKKHGMKLDSKKKELSEIFEKYDVKYNNKKSEEYNLNMLSEEIDKDIVVQNKKILDEDIVIKNENDETVYLVKTEDGKFMETKGLCKNKVGRPNRNIKPICHMNDDIKVLWEIDSDLNLRKAVFGGYIKSVLVPQNEENWIKRLEEVKQYIDVNGKRPSSIDKNKEIKQLGSWLLNQQQNYKKKLRIMKQSEIKKQWEDFIKKYNKYFLSNEDQWINRLKEVSKYIDENDKRPYSIDKNNDIKQLEQWLSTQQKNYKKKANIMTQSEIKKQWEDFIKKYNKYFLSNEDQWTNRLKEVSKYIDENDKRPSQCDKNNDIKQLGSWLSKQQQNYEKKSYIMTQSEIRKQWEDFIKKYNKYFLSNEDQWINRLKEVSKYIDENDKRPSNSDKNDNIKQLGRWINGHQQNYEKKLRIMKQSEIRQQWENFIKKYNKYFVSNEDQWANRLKEVSKYIDENDKRPSQSDKNNDIKQLGQWLSTQQKIYKKKAEIMKQFEIRQQWEDFIKKYNKYFLSNEDQWINRLKEVSKYIDENGKRPSSTDKNNDIKQLGTWLLNQQRNYEKKSQIMIQSEIRQQWEDFITKYQQYFPDNPAIREIRPKKIIKKSTEVKPKIELSKESSQKTSERKISDYQELTKKMSTQKSSNTSKMFKETPDLWHQYHDNRDFSFKGYDKQDEIPVNKIIAYLETKANHKLTILDLGCGRNLIAQHFKNNKKFMMTGYDHVSHNGSKQSDINNLPEEDDSIKICIYSQSLMGSNWKEYIEEGHRVLEYNGEIIISESVERYDTIKEYIGTLQMKIIKDDYDKTKRWFYIHAIKQ